MLYLSSAISCRVLSEVLKPQTRRVKASSTAPKSVNQLRKSAAESLSLPAEGIQPLQKTRAQAQHVKSSRLYQSVRNKFLQRMSGF